MPPTPQSPRTKSQRIIDAFLFDGELDLLEHRLRETYDLVDSFILVEAAQTFRGEPKPLTYAENRERFAWAADKITPVALGALGTPSSTAWERQAFQRNVLMLALRGAQPDDMVLILDADEIVSRSLLERLRREGLERPCRLAMTRHYQYLDQVAPRSACCPPPDAAFAFDGGRVHTADWQGLAPCWLGRSAVAVRYRDLTGDGVSGLPARSAYDFRRLMMRAPVLPDAGRHLLAVDRSGKLERKLSRVSHAELGDKRARDPSFLALAKHCAVHHHGWWYAEQPEGPLPDDLKRLAGRAPYMKRRIALPAMALRSSVRTWAWLRYWPALPDPLVRTIDRHFAGLLPLLVLPLAVAGLLRAAGAHFGWRWLRQLSSQSAGGHHAG